MRTPRIYQPEAALTEGGTIVLDEEGTNHLIKVLRRKTGDDVRIFDGKGSEFMGTVWLKRRTCYVELRQRIEPARESPMPLELAQVISRGNKMDLTLQKATELGVRHFYPLLSERCGVKLDEKRLKKKKGDYEKIVASACEQSGRAFVPDVDPIVKFEDFIAADHNASILILDPGEDRRIRDLRLPKSKSILLMAGPEGGFDPAEIELAKSKGALGISLGPRILRTETAAMTALSALGAIFGDL